MRSFSHRLFGLTGPGPKSRTGRGLTSFHRDAFGEVSRLIDVGAVEIGNVVRDELHGDHGDDGVDEGVVFGDEKDVVGHVGYFRVSLGGDDDEFALSGADFFKIGYRFFVKRALGGNADGGHVFVDEGDGAMFHLTRRISFGVDVRDFFELEGAFQGDGEVWAPAEVEKVSGLGVAAGNGDERGFSSQDSFDLLRDLAQPGQTLLRLLFVQGAEFSAKIDGQKIECNQLGGERFGGGDPDFGSGVGVHDTARLHALAGDGRFDDVANGEAGPLLSFGFFDGGQGVGGFAGLGDGQKPGMLVDDGVSVAKFAGEVAFDWDAGQGFDHEFAHHAGMKARPAGGDHQSLQVTNVLEVHAVQVYSGIFHRYPATDGVGDGRGLLEDLLVHEVFVATLFGHDRGPVDAAFLVLGWFAIKPCDLDVFSGDDGQLSIFKEHEVPGVFEAGRNVGRHKVFAFAHADHNGRGVFGRDDFVGFCARLNDKGVGASHGLEGVADCGHQVFTLFDLFGHQVRHDLRIGFAFERVPELFEALLELKMVFDDAVVDHRDAVHFVGVGIFFRRPSMGRPAGVSDADRALERFFRQRLVQISQFADCAPNGGLVVVDDGDAR